MSQADTAYSTEITPAQLQLTPTAATKLAELLAAADPDIDGVRVFVAGGGCGGMSYGMTYAERVTAYDSVATGPGYKLVVDSVALNFLHGCEIDFAGESFIFNNVFQVVGGSGTCGGCAGGGGF